MDSSKILSIRLPNPVLNIISTDYQVHTGADQELWNEETSFKDPSYLDVEGSSKPASVSISETRPTVLKVKLHVANDLRGKPFHLEARLRGTSRIAWSQVLNIQTSEKIIDVDANFRPPWAQLNFPWGIAGDLVWRTVQTDQSSARPIEDLKTTTRLEIYGLTSTLPTFFYERVHVNFLRALVLPARTSSAPDWTRYVIKAAFWDFGFVYASLDGGSARYAAGSTSGTYDLRGWTREVGTKKPLNCYDQAGLLQIALGLGPVEESEIKWQYIKPFGLLDTTQLIGRGLCNDPFPQRRAPVGQATPMLIADESDDRTEFENHAFIEVNGRIADACAGPHMGTETVEEYISRAIQTLGRSNWYARHHSRPSSKEDVKTYRGVTSLDRSWIRSKDFLISGIENRAKQGKKDDLEKIEALLKSASTGLPSTRGKTLSIDVPLITKHVSQGGDPVEIDKRVNEHGGQVSFTKPEISDKGLLLPETQITILRLESAETAGLHFSWMLDDVYHNVPLKYFRGPSPEEMKGQWNLVGETETPKHSVIIWVRENTFVKVEGPYMPGTLDKKYAKPIDMILQKSGSVPPFSFPNIKPSERLIEPGSRFTVKTSVSLSSPILPSK